MKGLLTLTRTKGGICMLKNLKKVAAIVLSFAMAVQFGLADSYYVNAVEEPVEPQQQEETTTTTPQEQEQVPTTEEETPQQQEEDAPAAEETNEQSAPETKSVELSYVAEDGTVLHETASRDFNLDYSLKTDSSVMLNFDGYTLKDVIINNSQTVPADQANLSVTSDLVSVKFVYVSVNTKEDKQTSENNEQTKTEEASEDDAEADPETKEELPEYPAFDQSETAGNVVVHATAAEGVLPRDSKLVVKRITRKAILNAVEDTVSEKNKEMDSAVALDITIQNKDGVEIQPNGSVNISFENAAVSGDEINIYHVTDDASAVTEVATNTQSFDANHFSIYVIAGENDVQLTTFNFVANGTTVSTQIVKTGDTLITPTAPDVAGKAFVGWYDGETKFEDFNTALTITETKTREITAKYEDALYVYFLKPDGSQIMRTEKVGDHEEHDFTTVSYDVDSTHKLVGWAEKANGTTNIADKISVPTDQTSVNVYAIIKKGYWITFDSNGGSAIDSQFVLNGDNLVLDKNTTPTKPGYTFDGWYNGSTKIETGATVTSSMTLKARWNATEVNYTVIHWWENADDDGYSFHESQKLQGLTGETTEAVAKSYTVDGKNIFGESVNDKVFNATTIEQKIIKGDGSTIVNVYYKRKTYTMHFKESWYPYNDLSTITKKWGQSISKNEWPTYYGNGNWKISSSKYLAYTSTMPMEDSKLWSTSGNYTYKAYYYVQKVDGNGYDLHHTDTIKMDSNPTIGKEDCYAISGFTFEYCNPNVGKSYNNAKFYYKRNSYDLNFINNGEPEKTVSKKYEQSIEDASYKPTRPSSLPDYYEFDGWYDNELCEGEAFNFTGKKMPAQNVTLYAKWTAIKINLTYNLNNPKGKVDEGTKEVEAGTVASTVLPSASPIEGYSFAGWYYADGNGNITSEVFHTGSTITRDTSIVGKWLYKGELSVAYNPGTETGATVPTDDRIYAGGARVTVAGNATTTSGKKFLGWELNGNVYMPGQSFEVNKDIANKYNQIILTATWGNAETSTTLTYDPGNGIGTAKRVVVMNNGAIEILAHDSNLLGFTAPVAEGKEYYFAGWADSSTGNATYADGQTINIDANGENVLYAVWVEKTEITLVANSGTRPYNGGEQSIEGFVSTTIDGYTVSGLTAVTKGTDVGEYTNTVFDGTAMVEKDGVDVTDKVVVKTTPGTLTITKAETMTLTPELTGKNAEKVYDSKPLSGGAKATVTEGTTITYSTDGGKTWSETLPSITNVGTLNVKAKAVNKNYEDATVEYTLKVTRKAVTVTANDKTKVFGEKDPEWTATVDGTLGDDTVKYTLSRKAGEDVGKYTITPSGKAEQGNYSVTYATGTLTITKAETMTLTPELTGKNAEKVYDSKPLSGGAKATVTEGTTITYSTDGGKTWSETLPSITNVGTLNVKAKAVNKNYEDATVEYTLKVTRKAVTVTANDKTKVFGEKDPEWTATVDGTLGDDTVKYTLSRKAGEDVGKYTITPSGKAEQGNYSVTYATGTLTITKAETMTLTPELTGKNAEKVYDSKPLSGGAKATVTEGTTITYSTDGGKTWSETLPSITNVGTLNVKAKAVNKNYEDATVEYTLKVTRKAVTVTANDKTKVFGEKDPEWTATVDGTLGDDTVKYTLSRKAGEDVGKYTITPSGKAEQGNYSVTYATGTLTITKAETMTLTPELTGKNAEKVYDSKPLSGGAKATVTEGTTITYSTDGGKTWSETLPSITNVGTLNVKAKAVNKNYEDATVEYTLKVTRKAVTVTANDKTKVFGEKDPEWTATVDGTLGDDTVKYTLSRKAGEDVGKYTITPSGKAEQGNYSVTYATGTLTITKAETMTLTPELTGKNAEKVYDSKPLSGGAKATVTEGTTITYSTDGGKTWSETLPSITNVGTLNVKAKAVNKNYEDATVEYTLKVTRKAVTVTANDKTKVFGEKDPEWTATVDGTLGDDTVKYTLSRKAGEDVGKYTITPSGKAEQGNYSVTYATGTLTITKAETMTLTPELTGKNAEKVYDSKPLSGGAKATVTEGTTITYSTDGGKTWSETLPSITNVGTLNVKAKAVNKNYEDATVEYTLKVTRKAVTVTANDKTKVFGEKDPEWTATVDGTLGDDTVKYTLSRKAGEDVGKYTITPSGKAEQGNYSVTYATGTLTITKAETMTLTPELTGKNAEKVYDSKPLSGGAKATVTEGTTITYSTDGGKTWSETLPSITNVGTLNVKAKAVNKNYEDATVEYTLKVTRKAVTVTANDKTKVFGEKDPEWTATVDGTLGDDTVKYTLSRKAGEDVGKYTITPSGKAEQGNYSVTYATGTLTITKAETMTLTPELTGKNAEKVYDSKPLSGGAKATVTEGTTITYSTDGGKTWSETLPSITNVGTLNVKAKAVNKNYEDATVEYTLKVTRKAVTVTANDKTKVFGEKDPEWTATVDGTLGDDTVKYTLSRKAGEDVGKYTITPSGKAEQGNYSVTYATGTLTITSQSIDPGTDPEKPNPDYTGAKVNSPSDEVYDGKEHKWIPTVTDKEGNELVAKTDYEVTYSTTDFTNVTGTITVTITGIGNYTGKATRTYSITPKTYTVTTESDSKVYDGTALTAGGKVSGIVKGETVDFTITGSQTSVGTSDNTYELNWTGSAKESNYKHGKDSIGTLTVKAKSIVPDGPDTPDEKKTGITVSDPSDSKYDGKEHREVLTVQDTKKYDELVAEKDYSVTYSDDLVNAGTVTITIEGIGNYTGSFTKTYEITKRSVTLTSATASKTYDGQALTSTSITVSGDGFVKGEGATYNVTGTQTEVGNSANSFEYKLNEKTLASNYNITKVVGTLTITAAPAPATPATPSTPSSTTSTTPRTPSAPQVTTPAETVEKETTPKAEPKKEEKVEEEYTPKASPQYYWALINLICAILTVLFGLLLLISKRHKDEDDDEEDDETKQQTTNDDEEKEQEKKRGLFTRVLAVLIAIVSVVFFLVTEDLSLPWTWTDQWTIWMVVIGLVQIVVFFVGRKWKNVDNDDEDEEAQQA